MTLPNTTPLTNKAPPNKAPIEREIFSFLAAKIEEKTSGAPFPKASRLTPATVGDSLRVSEILARAGEKY
jgi:hypothetical protein